ncbi:MAG: alpha-galactosidase [Bacteroidia bacterium]|nr:alpha-galactosidase [Bacteroidia bacterium]
MNKKMIGLVCAFFGWLSVGAQQKINLAEMNVSVLWQEYGMPQVGRLTTGEAAVFNGKRTTDVVGLHARALAKFKLNGQTIRFSAQFGIPASKIDPSHPDWMVNPLVDGTKLIYKKEGTGKQFLGFIGKDGKLSVGSVRLSLIADGKEIYNSGIVRGGEPLRRIDVGLANVKLLELMVDPTEDGPSGDQVALISPVFDYLVDKPELVEVFSTREGAEMPIATLNRLKNKLKTLPVMNAAVSEKTGFDWLLYPERSKAGIYTTPDGKGLVIANAMVSRTFRLFPNLATVGITNRMLGESLLRAVSSEGTLTVDGKRWNIGGLGGQPERGYLKQEWLDQMKALPESFLVENFEITSVKPPINWARSRWALNKEWATGKELIFTLFGEKELKDVCIKLHFAIYDGLPIIKKWFEVVNRSALPINIDRFQLESLAFFEPESPGGGDPSLFRLPNIHVESDYACGGGFTEMESNLTNRWLRDEAYTSQRNYMLQMPCILEVAPEIGPDYTLASLATFSSFSVYEMPFDNDDRERKGLFTRRLYRDLTPWTTENPIFMHLTSSDPEVVRRAVDQCAETGYEMIILSFGSGVNAEDISESNILKYKELVDYARSRGIEMGCYSLLASRWISDEVDVINPKTGKRGGMRFGSSPCLGSDWGSDYFNRIRLFFEKTGMRCFEHDGSYPGDVCGSTVHTHHKGLNDSQWNQFYKIAPFYRWMSEQGIYMNVPDFYFQNGSNKVGIGYRETNWSLPRDRQLMHARQLNYDCTWERVPSSLWSFVPLVEYHGGGSEATLEPLSEHLYEYKMHMIQNYGAGIQACYRGPRLYDTAETK